ncbi:hypothetical protein SESBI_26750 [Sesbania bispinosa]|nr:hypothetical protein SESBI_26750 [Sesbania bispinosa]
MCDHGRRGGERGEGAKPKVESSDDSKVARGSGLVMEKVAILRRGNHSIRRETIGKEGEQSFGGCCIAGRRMRSCFSIDDKAAGHAGVNSGKRDAGEAEEVTVAEDRWSHGVYAWLRVIGWWRRDQHLKGCEVFTVTKGHKDSGGAPSHDRENGGAGCTLRPEHRKMVRLLGRCGSGTTERCTKNN